MDVGVSPPPCIFHRIEYPKEWPPRVKRLALPCADCNAVKRLDRREYEGIINRWRRLAAELRFD